MPGVRAGSAASHHDSAEVGGTAGPWGSGMLRWKSSNGRRICRCGGFVGVGDGLGVIRIDRVGKGLCGTLVGVFCGVLVGSMVEVAYGTGVLRGGAVGSGIGVSTAGAGT